MKEVEVEAELLEVMTDPLITQLLSELNTMLSGLASRESYGSVGAKYMQTKSAQYTMQRCFESSDVAPNMYRSSKKSVMAARFKRG